MHNKTLFFQKKKVINLCTGCHQTPQLLTNVIPYKITLILLRFQFEQTNDFMTQFKVNTTTTKCTK